MQSAPLLLIDCYLDDFGCPPLFVPPATQFERVRVAHVDLDQVPTSVSGYAGVVISGSAASVLDELPWSLRVEQLIHDARATGTPVFGICYGHQLIAKTLFESTRKAPRPEVGWFSIQQTQPETAALPGDLPPSFTCFLSHFDEVVDPGHADFQVLASSERCAVQAFRVADEPIWGVQFHAEMDATETRDLFEMRISKCPELGIDREQMLASASYDAGLWRGLYDAFLGLLSSRDSD